MILTATCVNATGREVDAYDETEREISVKHAMRRIGQSALREAFPFYEWRPGKQRDLRFKDDYHISAGVGIFRGRRAVVIHHSSIHHFFQ